VFDPMKNECIAAWPLGVNTSMINSVVPGGTTATNGTFSTELVWSATFTVVVAIWVRVPPGNVPVVCVYKRTVTGCVVPVPFALAVSIPKSTEVTL
jgi:hypothetical protein